MNVQPIQHSFSAGEITPKMWGRSDVDGFGQSCKELRNMITYAHGPGTTRGGFEKMYFPSGVSKRKIPFYMTPTLNFELVIQSGQMYILDEDGTQVASIATAPWTSRFDEIQWAMPPSADVMIIVHPDEAPRMLDYDGGSWSFTTIAFTNAPADWTSGNYPKSITFFQGRSWWGGSDTFPETVWASKSGYYYNFTGIGTNTEADDPISFTIDKRGAINWLFGIKKLLIGTVDGEYMFDSEGGILIPGDIRVDRQSGHGSASIQPIELDNGLLYVSSDNRKLRHISYNWEGDEWQSKDLIFMSEHFTEDDGIVALAYAKNPDSIIWCATSTGNLLGCTWEKESKIVGWHKHDSGSGTVTDICVVERLGTSYLWAIIEGTNGSISCRMDNDVFMDAYATQTNSPASTAVGPFLHLASETVSCLVDGAVHDTITLDASGEGTTDVAGAEILVGHLVNPRLETLPISTHQELKGIDHYNKRWAKIYVRILLSSKPLINGKRPPTRYPATLMGAVEELVTEDVQVTTLGYDSEGTVIITQDIPKRVTVLGLFGELAIERI